MVEIKHKREEKIEDKGKLLGGDKKEVQVTETVEEA